MRTPRRTHPARLLGALAALGVLLATLAACTLPEARGYSIDSVVVDAELRADGTLEVSETLTYTFRGADDDPFTVGTRTFDVVPDAPEGVIVAPSGTIRELAAFDEDGDQLPTLVSTPSLFEWDIAPARSGTYVYELRYEVDGALRVGSDVVELYRQWIGDDFPALDQVDITVEVPPGEGDVLVWAHGPLDGVIGTEGATGSTVVAEVSDVPAGQFVETRVAVPVERFAVAPGAAEILPEIVAEEEEWAADANERREQARQDEIDRAEAEERREDAARVLDVIVVPLAAIAAWGFWMIWRRWGRDPKKPEDIGDYWREVPDDPPAVAAAFLKWGTVDGDAYSGTVLDLARRGHLRIEEIAVERLLRKDDVQHRFIRTQGTITDPLRPFEQRVLSWMFRDGPEITQEELVERNREKQTESHKMWTGFQKEVKEDLDARGYVVRGKHAAFGLHALIVLALVGLAVASAVVQAWIGLAVAAVTAVVLLPLGVLHRSRTPEGTRRFWEWRGLRQFMKDFSSLDEAPVGHLALWEQYLVAAVALGVAEELVDGLEVWFPQVLQEGSNFAPWYVATAGGHGRLGAVGSFGSSFGGAAVSSSTPQSSGGGGGGGFSGGGGGGGGGGGAGAR